MLKNHKILASIIVVVTIGIVSVLSFWLYNSYGGRREVLQTQADQALLNVLYDYYSTKESTGYTYRNSYQKNLAEDIRTRYPEISLDSIYGWMDDNATRRQDSLRESYHDRAQRQPKERRRRGREINPWFIYSRDTSLTRETLQYLQQQFAEELDYVNITGVDTKIQVQKIGRNKRQYFNKRSQMFRFGTRPILINPENDLYMWADVFHTWKYIGSKMLGQIIFSLALLGSIVFTFYTLYKTNRQQNKLARLQRSFVTNMTHELKTPLSTVTAAVEAIQRYAGRDDAARRDKYLDLSRRELDHLTTMVERVLQFSTDENQGLHLVKSEMDLVKLVYEAVEALQVSANRPVQCVIKHRMEKLSFLGDESHLRNVLSNLLDNAIKYNPSPDPTITILLDTLRNGVEISVADNGLGIPTAFHKDIFTLFFRVPNGEIYSVKGFGLGLAYVQQVVHQHGGDVAVSNENPHGARITIRLPNNSAELKK